MGAHKKYKYEPDYAVAPGETLREVMESRGMSQKDMSVRTGLTVQTINRIFKGVQPISYETANRLELVTGVPAGFWNNLEAQYREQLAKLSEKARLEKDIDWLDSIPTKELIDRGVIHNHTDKVLLLRETLGFFGVSSVEAWHEIWNTPAVAARRSACFETIPGAASVWIRLGELQAQDIACDPYDNSRFKSTIEEIRLLTRETPDIFVPKILDLCAQSGVALALVKEIRNVPWNGASKWLTPDKAMIMLSLRGKGEDKFWFSFFHEAGHVLHDNKKELYIADGSDDPTEQAADRFAADTLIPKRYNSVIVACRSEREIIALADELLISPGIVAGRYQFITHKWSWYKKLIRTFRWSPS